MSTRLPSRRRSPSSSRESVPSRSPRAIECLSLIENPGSYAAVAIPHEARASESGNTLQGPHKPLGQPEAMCSQIAEWYAGEGCGVLFVEALLTARGRHHNRQLAAPSRARGRARKGEALTRQEEILQQILGEVQKCRTQIFYLLGFQLGKVAAFCGWLPVPVTCRPRSR